jgi:hypothetical protein
MGIASVLYKARSFPLTVTIEKALKHKATSKNKKIPVMKGFSASSISLMYLRGEI